MTPQPLSNSLTDIADRIREASQNSETARRTSIEQAMVAGNLLCEARQSCRHGEWLPFLERAGIADRTARNFMTLSRSGLEIGHVADLGGIGAALKFLSAWRAPKFNEALLIHSADGLEVFGTEDDPGGTLGSIGYVWEDGEHRGFYNVAAINKDDVVSLGRPMRPFVEIDGDRPVHTIRHWLTLHLDLPMNDWLLDYCPRHIPEIVLGATPA